jgi:transposase
VLIETFIRKQLALKAHRVTKVEETGEQMGSSHRPTGEAAAALRYRQRSLQVHSIRKERQCRDLSIRKVTLILCYRPRRVECPRCGIRVEDFPWAEPWMRVTRAGKTVASLAPELSWQETARHYGLNWKTVAGIIQRAVQYGLRKRKRLPLHVMGIDEVMRLSNGALEGMNTKTKSISHRSFGFRSARNFIAAVYHGLRAVAATA